MPPPAPEEPALSIVQPLLPRTDSVDIVVCVHNALDDVQRCLASVLTHSSAPYALILVDDGSAAATRDWLAAFAAEHRCTLLRNEQAQGYTLAANRGLRQSGAPFVVLLNSDTVVGAGWLERLLTCAQSSPSVGMVGPLSNTASWQSIPTIEHDGDWAANALPPGWTVDEMAAWVARWSGQVYPRLGFLNGFCLLIRRELLDRIGLFDEVTFAKGYGEENDFALRATAQGFALAVADDVYVFHAQSRSYSHERRRQLAEQAGLALAAKHPPAAIGAGIERCRHDRVMQGVRARARQLFARAELIHDGRTRFGGKRVLFVLPIIEGGGGANVIISEARALLRMGVLCELLNFESSRARFESGYPGLEVPVRYVANEAEVAAAAADFDAVIATLNISVFWIAPLRELAGRRPVLGYYIQDFEPWFYAKGSSAEMTALASYTALPDLVCLTKTEWNAQTVQQATGQGCTVIGPSFETDLFMPRRRRNETGVVRVVAMIRPSTPRRAPRLTMQVLRDIAAEFGPRVHIQLFGCDPQSPEFLALPLDFEWQHAGVLTPAQMALLLNQNDVFVDFSEYQAMGLTAMEAMACGLAVVLPQRGGFASFASDGHNALVVDTASAGACRDALRRLIIEDALRLRLQQQALQDVAEHFPERAAHRLLQALFDAPAGAGVRAGPSAPAAATESPPATVATAP